MNLRYLFFATILFFLNIRPVQAIVNPADFPNNKVGVHIFSPEEIDKVPALVNSSGGAWGYVTVPLRADDRNREKWQEFMHQCKKFKIIPIIRLATTMGSNSWSKPSQYDYIDFANFLNDLDWPTKNRYVIVYNEPNHASEWGGEINPNEYAHELNRTIEILKDRSVDFFVLPAGLDVAAPSDSQHLTWRRFLSAMYSAKPESLKNLDGWNSHAYPNPAFSGKPTDTHDHSINSFQNETAYLKSLTGKDLPVFITETGWSNKALSDETVATYLQTAFAQNWNKDNIIAVTPFVLQAGGAPFDQFSLLDTDGEPKPQYQTIKWMTKVKGEPKLAPLKGQIKIPKKVLGVSTPSAEMSLNSQFQAQVERSFARFLKWLKKN